MPDIPILLLTMFYGWNILLTVWVLWLTFTKGG